ncbi:hypothetical protein [Phenylobacterium sp.]|uniref:hypothetical protein n=1 Tax=Phenylobacterium sp. TaxID=1871053 RepID=UPI0035AEF89E
MTSPIDPVRRIARARKADRASQQARGANGGSPEDAAPPEAAARPLTVDPVDEAAFNAHRMGQERRRGLRAGQGVLEAAKTAYVRTEYSGAADRRLPNGAIARTKV